MEAQHGNLRRSVAAPRPTARVGFDPAEIPVPELFSLKLLIIDTCPLELIPEASQFLNRVHMRPFFYKNFIIQ
jgi:hypothetical protein